MKTVKFNLHGKEYTVNEENMLRVQCNLAERIKEGLAKVGEGKSVAECLRDTLQEIDAELNARPKPVNLDTFFGSKEPHDVHRITGG